MLGEYIEVDGMVIEVVKLEAANITDATEVREVGWFRLLLCAARRACVSQSVRCGVRRPLMVRLRCAHLDPLPLFHPRC